MDLSSLDPILITILFVVFLAVIGILYLGSYLIYRKFDEKDNEMIKKSAEELNDAFYSSTVFDENTKTELKRVRGALSDLEQKNKQQKSLTGEMDAKLLSIDTKFKAFQSENDKTVDELKTTARNLPFETQLKRIQDLSQKNITHDTSITALRNDDASQDVRIAQLNKDYADLDTKLKRTEQSFYSIQGSYVPKNSMNATYVTNVDFSKGVGELNTALANLNKTIQNMPFDYKTKEEIDNLSTQNLFIIEKLNSMTTMFKAIEGQYITDTDVRNALDKEKGLLITMLATLDGFNQTINAMRTILDKMPSMYVSNADFAVIRRITTLLSSSILKVIDNSRINFDANVGVNTTAPQSKFHVVDNTNNWCAKIQNRDTVVNFATNIGNGMNIALQGQSDGSKYGLQLRNGDGKVLLQTLNNGTTFIDGNATAPVFRAKNQICINGVCLNERDLINLRGFQPQ
jgi:hypothetical protein